MKKKTIIIAIVCILLATVVTLSIRGQQKVQAEDPGAYAGYVPRLTTAPTPIMVPGNTAPWETPYVPNN